MNILITGGLGFIGSNLAERSLELGHEVKILSRSDRKIRNIKGLEDKVDLVLKDVKDIGREVKGMDRIFHCASTVDNYNIHEDPYRDVRINCDGTIALLEAVKNNNPKVRIIYPSTFFVNGNLSELPATPDSPCNPQGLYPVTRLAGEHFCKIYNNVFEMDSVIARFTNVFGIREQRDNKKKAAFNYLIGLAMKDKEIPLYGRGEFIRDYIYVSDVIDGLLAIAEKGIKGEIYYVGRGEQTRFKDLMKMVVEEADGGRINPIEPPDFHKQVGITDYYCDNAPLRQLGWAPRVSLREGIRRTIEFYKNER